MGSHEGKAVENQTTENGDRTKIFFDKLLEDIFKNAEELVALCAAQVAIIVFSPEGKSYKFGFPSLPSVIERFLNLAYASADHASSQQRRPSVEDMFKEHASKIFDMVRLGMNSQEISKLKLPSGMTRDELLEFTRLIDQVLAKVSETMEKKKNHQQAAAASSSSSGSKP